MYSWWNDVKKILNENVNLKLNSSWRIKTRGFQLARLFKIFSGRMSMNNEYLQQTSIDWQLSNCGFFLENQRQFFHGTK